MEKKKKPPNLLNKGKYFKQFFSVLKKVELKKFLNVLKIAKGKKVLNVLKIVKGKKYP